WRVGFDGHAADRVAVVVVTREGEAIIRMPSVFVRFARATLVARRIGGELRRAAGAAEMPGAAVVLGAMGRVCAHRHAADWIAQSRRRARFVWRVWAWRGHAGSSPASALRIGQASARPWPGHAATRVLRPS